MYPNRVAFDEANLFDNTIDKLRKDMSKLTDDHKAQLNFIDHHASLIWLVQDVEEAADDLMLLLAVDAFHCVLEIVEVIGAHLDQMPQL